jgi:hypothetical protein
MKVIDGLLDAMSELLIENRRMKQLLSGTSIDLKRILNEAKADSETRQLVQERLAPLRTAISDEVDIERMIQEIMERPMKGEPN